MNRPVAKPDTVTLDALLSAIRNAVDSGRIGTPVNVRVHWQFSETDMKHAALVAVRIADEALALEEPAWRIRASELEASNSPLKKGSDPLEGVATQGKTGRPERVRHLFQRTAKGRILNVLGEDRRGRTLLATLCRGDANEFALTVFGNHGTLRLEHAGLEESSLEPVDTDAGWWRDLTESIG